MGAEDMRLEVVGTREAGELGIELSPAGADPEAAGSLVFRRDRPIDERGSSPRLGLGSSCLCAAGSNQAGKRETLW